MRIVDHPAIRPHRCAVIPYLGASNASGFIDTGMDLDREHVYVSFEAVCEMAKMLGWVGPSVAKGQEARIAELEAEIDDLHAQLQEADRFAEAAEYTLGRFGSKVQNKPGRKPKTEKVA